MLFIQILVILNFSIICAVSIAFYIILIRKTRIDVVTKTEPEKSIIAENVDKWIAGRREHKKDEKKQAFRGGVKHLTPENDDILGDE